MTRALDDVMSEDELLQAITEAATYTGWRWVHFRPAQTSQGWRTPTQGHTGFPDLVLAKGGRILFLELKRQGGKTTPDQDAWIAALSGDGMRALAGADGWVDALVVRPSDLDGVLSELGAKVRGRPGAISESELFRGYRGAARESG